MQKPTIRQRVRYAFDNTMARGTSALIFWLVVATGVLVAFFTAIVLIGKLAPGGKHRSGVIGQLFKSFLHSLDPGTVAGDSGKWPFLLVMLLLTLGGLLIVSALIGVLATGLDRKLDELRKGRSVVLEENHTLILGWSETIFTILSELEAANASEKDPSIVILSERDRVEMEDAIRAKLHGERSTRIICRSGSPVDLADLRVARPETARSVIVLSPEDDPDPDAQVIKTVLALTRSPGRREHPYRIVAEIHDPANLEAARLVGGDEAVLVDKRETISRLLVQSSRQSGASVVYNELLDFEGDEIYFRRDPRLEGMTFGEALFAYDDCSVIGLRSDGSVLLNPHPALPIGGSTEVIAIAEDDGRLAAAQAFEGKVDEDAIVDGAESEPGSARVLLLGWNSRTSSVVAEFDKYLADGSELKVVADWPGAREAIEREVGELAHTRLEFEQGSTTDRRTLDGLDVPSYDHVVVMCYSEMLDHQRADARTLVTLLHLRDIVGRADSKLTITSEMLDDRNRELAQVTQVDDVIVSDRFLSLLLSQLSENEHLAGVFADLFAAEGSEIYLRPVGDYVRPGREISFATVVEAARRRREVAVGYRVKEDADDPSPSGFRINPPKSERITLDEDDRVIVLAED